MLFPPWKQTWIRSVRNQSYGRKISALSRVSCVRLHPQSIRALPLCSSHIENKMHYHQATLSHNEQRTSFLYLLSIRRLVGAGEEDRQKTTHDRAGRARACALWWVFCALCCLENAHQSLACIFTFMAGMMLYCLYISLIAAHSSQWRSFNSLLLTPNYPWS